MTGDPSAVPVAAALRVIGEAWRGDWSGLVDGRDGRRMLVTVAAAIDAGLPTVDLTEFSALCVQHECWSWVCDETTELRAEHAAGQTAETT